MPLYEIFAVELILMISYVLYVVTSHLLTGYCYVILFACAVIVIRFFICLNCMNIIVVVSSLKKKISVFVIFIFYRIGVAKRANTVRLITSCVSGPRCIL